MKIEDKEIKGNGKKDALIFYRSCHLFSNFILSFLP